MEHQNQNYGLYQKACHQLWHAYMAIILKLIAAWIKTFEM